MVSIIRTPTGACETMFISPLPTLYHVNKSTFIGLNVRCWYSDGTPAHIGGFSVGFSRSARSTAKPWLQCHRPAVVSNAPFFVPEIHKGPPFTAQRMLRICTARLHLCDSRPQRLNDEHCPLPSPALTALHIAFFFLMRQHLSLC